MEMKSLSPKSLYVKTYGRLDLDNAMKYGTEIKDKVEDDEITDLTWDFSEVTFISSFGLKVILEIYQIMKEPAVVRITNAADSVKKSFTMAGFEQFIKIM